MMLVTIFMIYIAVISAVVATVCSILNTPTTKQINKNAVNTISKAEIKGKTGEIIVTNKLNRLDGYKKVINNIMINDQGKSRQIDHIAITEHGVFVIETKNYAGKIYGKETSTDWLQYLQGKKNQFKNPIHQNYGHFKIVKSIIDDENVYVEPVVVFIDGCKLNITTKSKVTYVSMINNYIQSKPKVLSLEKINNIYNTIINNRITDEETLQDHDYNVQKYREYKNKIADSEICPRCGAKLILRNSKNGKFYGCSQYPRCKYIKNI